MRPNATILLPIFACGPIATRKRENAVKSPTFERLAVATVSLGAQKAHWT